MPNPKGETARFIHVMSKQSRAKRKKRDVETDKKNVRRKERDVETDTHTTKGIGKDDRGRYRMKFGKEK